MSRPRCLSWSAIHVPSIGERHTGWPTQCRMSIAQVLEDDRHICVDFVWSRTCLNDREFRSPMEANRKLCRGVPVPSHDENLRRKHQNVVAHCRVAYHGGSIGLSVVRFGYSWDADRIEIGVTQCLLHHRVSRVPTQNSIRPLGHIKNLGCVRGLRISLNFR